MRHKYATEGVVLRSTPLAEASASVILLTQELGLVRARAQGVKKPGAKLAPALTTFCQSDLTLMRGKEGWRLSGAIQTRDHFTHLPRVARERAGRIALLILRLVSSDSGGEDLYALFLSYLERLAELSEEEGDHAEVLAALYLLSALGLDAGEKVPQGDGIFGEEALTYARTYRTELISRVNRGIQASGL